MVRIGKPVRLAVIIAWLLVVPAGFVWLWYTREPLDSVSLSVLFTATLLAMAAVYFPVTRNGIPLSLVGWLTLPAFFLGGIFAEAAMMQIAVLAAIPGNKKSPDPLHRFFFNSLMFFVLSVVSGAAFYAAGGVTKGIGLTELVLPAAAYLTVHTMGNIGFIHLYQKLIGNPYPFRIRLIRQDLIAALVVFPYALSAYYLYLSIGAASLPILAIPFFSFILLMRLYDTTERVNEMLAQAAELGHGMSGKLTQPEVLDLFVRKIPELVPVDFLNIYDIRNGRVEPLKLMENGEMLVNITRSKGEDTGIGSMVYHSRKGRLFGSREEWEVFSDGSVHPDAESLIGVHIVRNKTVEGVLTVKSKRPYAYEEHHLRVLELLGSYLAVALEKSRHVQKTVRESERCALTGLYNYRYMETALHRYVDQVKRRESETLSCVMLDIDHFKKINDIHGHQGGNTVLSEFARLLQQRSDPSWTVSRYGGEEFVILMPGVSKEKAITFSEAFRREVEDHAFTVDPDGDAGPALIPVTVSIGVAAAPADGDSAMGLIRNADRALYTGAKQVGRNKVAAYTG
ncbi:diguanylate cyclase (GGDEF) domain-containing protein [Bhargavaea ginsengi]|uniref:Diguanylate cyclase (GGDEF) domain-containing protein n=1 Tax=Bhargavaea ginsengi TaxID=426757 RepID=A0A1H6X895_9BACL|nr:sensor domain-containing diguanylate cyclase [Bhargavaea ginsengi]SEJ25338.1 diguanylate cyclase (GGDEF) domain-containing protein [Bhargavaea ginsengi]